MEAMRNLLKVFMWLLIIGFSSQKVLQMVAYSFYKGDRQLEQVAVEPQFIDYGGGLTGYGYGLDLESDSVILAFGGSGYIAYNTVGLFAQDYSVPFLAVDYYGSQGSSGKMNLATMKASAEGLYDWVEDQYPERKIIVLGHSYGCGMAAYLASARPCHHLVMMASYRDLSDLYNKILPIFWGPAKLFIGDNIRVKEYANTTRCHVTIIGSEADKTLSSQLQQKVAHYYDQVQVIIYPDIDHEDYLRDQRVIAEIKALLE